jgi:hypothetical protein
MIFGSWVGGSKSPFVRRLFKITAIGGICIGPPLFPLLSSPRLGTDRVRSLSPWKLSRDRDALDIRYAGPHDPAWVHRSYQVLTFKATAGGCKVRPPGPAMAIVFKKAMYRLLPKGKVKRNTMLFLKFLCINNEKTAILIKRRGSFDICCPKTTIQIVAFNKHIRP